MQLIYQKQEQKTRITYGEILTNSIKPAAYANKHLVIFTNQRYYDRFFDKLARVFKGATIDWYVCSNLVYGNTVSELMDALHFLKRFSANEAYLFVAFGNEGVVQLTGFLSQITPLKNTYWVLPISLRAYMQALVKESTICDGPLDTLMTTQALPEQIFLDQTIAQKQLDGKLVDLQMFIRTGLVCDHGFLQNLYSNFPSQKELESTAFSALVEPVTRFYQKDAEKIVAFGRVFEAAFYLTEKGHLLSESMKRFLGLLFHLIWNLPSLKEAFHIENFMHWLGQLGFPIFLPEQISVAEYLQNVLKLQAKENGLVVLQKIGTMREKQFATEQNLLPALETYQKICTKI